MRARRKIREELAEGTVAMTAPFFFKWVRFDDVEDHLRMGWTVSLLRSGGDHHCYWSVYMMWRCSCHLAQKPPSLATFR